MCKSKKKMGEKNWGEEFDRVFYYSLSLSFEQECSLPILVAFPKSVAFPFLGNCTFD
jgi:hypothetical protein